MPPMPPPIPPRPDAERLHALQVQQVALERQNEVLRQTLAKLGAERAQYVDLYERAPVGYLTVCNKGTVRHANLTAGTLLGVARGALLGQVLSHFLLPDDAGIFDDVCKKTRLNAAPKSCELRLRKQSQPETPVWLHLALSRALDEHGAPVLRIILSDISERMQAESELRVAAAAFECQEGFVVLNKHFKILRANHAFAQITGYTEQEVKGKNRRLLRSDSHPPAFYQAFWQDEPSSGGLFQEMWMRRKTGEDFLAQVAKTTVRNAQGQLTHYVVNFTDITQIHQQEAQRLQNESRHRNALVREVHHRIKNNLQGITGLLSQFAKTHPATAEPIKQAISQVQGISVIHGLQGLNNTSSVHLCELLQAIAAEAEMLWQTALVLDVPRQRCNRMVTEKEAVPIALILNELVLNAVKHGGQAQGEVGISLHQGAQADTVNICIRNAGQLAPAGGKPGVRHNGLKLIAALMPPEGARISRRQDGDSVITLLELAPPVIFFETPGSL